MHHVRLSAAMAAAIILGSATSASALTINVTYDASITGRSNAATIERAFQTAVSGFRTQFNTPVQVNLAVSWGTVGGQALQSNALGSSSTSLYGYFSYAQMKSWLTGAASTVQDKQAVATLPATAPAGQNQYVLTSAQAKALGLVSGSGTGRDGSIGFGSSTPFTFDDSNGVAANTYDFVPVAAHEISEVLGRISGLSSATPSYATALDLFRFASPGQRTFSYSGNGYFSLDNGTTDLVNFNHSSNGGDRGDYLSNSSTTDAVDAFTYSGTVNRFSALDQTVLDVIGWSSTGTGATPTQYVTLSNVIGQELTVPEPASLALLGVGLLGVVGLRRRG